MFLTPGSYSKELSPVDEHGVDQLDTYFLNFVNDERYR
jgi:hypothetical protein